MNKPFLYVTIDYGVLSLLNVSKDAYVLVRFGCYMDTEKRQKYYEILERITDMTCQPENFDREAFVDCLNEFCDLFKISKGVTEFYTNVRFESQGVGEVLVDRDNGHGDIEILNRRIVPKTGVVIIGRLYRAKEDEPLTEEEMEKVDMVHRLLMSFIARNRLQRTVYMFAFFDEDEYKNRRAFMRYIDEKIEAHEQYKYTAICINLRQFSLVNQDLGRRVGDIVLRNYYNYISSVVGDDGIVARLGGDNFMMFIKSELTEQLITVFRGVPIYYDANDKDKYVMITARAGAYVPNNKEPLMHPGQIMDKVYPAIQIAKQRGIAVVFYDEKIDDDRKNVIRIRHQFFDGLEKGEFQAYYQPKVDVETGSIVGAEALCRWFHNGKMVMPMEFIPILEMYNDISRLDFHMLVLVCRDIRRWLDEGRRVPRISVNLSRQHLDDVHLVDKLLKTINSYRVPHEYIEIELTETNNDVEFKDLNRVVCGLKDEGICTSVDDFGNGFSSLNLIRSVPWNVVKIDRMLLPTDEDNTDSVTSRMYEHIISMANDIGLECVSEGVETIKQVELLKKNHCQVAQGFYFDRPLPVEEFEARLEGTPYKDKL